MANGIDDVGNGKTFNDPIKYPINKIDPIAFSCYMFRK